MKPSNDREAPRPGDPAARLVEIAPGRYTLAPAGRKAPELVVCRLLPDGAGAMRLLPECITWARVSHELLKVLGLPRQFLTLYRLNRAGFIEMVRIAPHTYLLNMDSWFNHVQRCAESRDEFWEPSGKNRAAYRKAIGG